MAIKLQQSMRQSQHLAMTPQLRQAIKMLMMTRMELATVLEKELEENPLLEEFSEENPDHLKPTEEDESIRNLERNTHEALANDFERGKSLSKAEDTTDWDKYLEDYASNSTTPPSMAVAETDDSHSYENVATRGETLEEHLEWQLRMHEINPEEAEFATDVIYNLNDDGYLDASFDELVNESGLAPEDAEEVLKLIQSFDPVGCGSRNMEECLLSQVRTLPEPNSLVEEIIRHHLPLLEKNDAEAIAKELNKPLEKIVEAVQIIGSLNPKPGRALTGETTQYVVPDIFIEEVGGEFVVLLNEEGFPRLKISDIYREMMKKGDKDEQRYVKDKLRNAIWLIKSVQNRQKTIFRVSEAILRNQADFFKKGPEHLRPMTLKAIGDELGLHESTISRVTTNKFMATPFGTLELKYFFNGAVGGKSGGIEFASMSVKTKIQGLVSKEGPENPLTDDQLVQMLAREGVKVARRTVSKYREELRIPGSSERKRLSRRPRTVK